MSDYSREFIDRLNSMMMACLQDALKREMHDTGCDMRSALDRVIQGEIIVGVEVEGEGWFQWVPFELSNGRTMLKVMKAESPDDKIVRMVDLGTPPMAQKAAPAPGWH